MNDSQADKMIESGHPLKEIVPMFPTKVAACEYFASSMTQRFATADQCCAGCGEACETPPLAFTWRANLHTTKTVLLSFLFTALAIFAHHLYSRWVVVQFTTFHRLCSHCRRRHRMRTIAISIIRHGLFAVLMLLLFLTVPLVVFLFAAIFAIPEALWVTLGATILGLTLLGLVAWAFEACRRSSIPRSLRHIGQFPFFLRGLRDT